MVVCIFLPYFTIPFVPIIIIYKMTERLAMYTRFTPDLHLIYT